MPAVHRRENRFLKNSNRDTANMISLLEPLGMGFEKVSI